MNLDSPFELTLGGSMVEWLLGWFGGWRRYAPAEKLSGGDAPRRVRNERREGTAFLFSSRGGAETRRMGGATSSLPQSGGTRLVALRCSGT